MSKLDPCAPGNCSTRFSIFPLVPKSFIKFSFHIHSFVFGCRYINKFTSVSAMRFHIFLLHSSLTHTLVNIKLYLDVWLEPGMQSIRISLNSLLKWETYNKTMLFWKKKKTLYGFKDHKLDYNLIHVLNFSMLFVSILIQLTLNITFLLYKNYDSTTSIITPIWKIWCLLHVLKKRKREMRHF